MGGCLDVDYGRSDHQAVVCEGTSTQLTCSEGQSLAMTSALWGRGDARTCSRGGSAQQTASPTARVAYVNVTDTLRQLCDNRSRCDVTADVTTLGDPRPGPASPPIYLLVNYSCQSIILNTLLLLLVCV